MKKIINKLGLFVVAVSLVMLSTTSAFAAIECFNMQVVMAGSKFVGAEQINIVRVEKGSTACGDMAAGDRRTFNFSAVNGDAGLATALTGHSLSQSVYLVLTSNIAEAGTTVEAIMVTAP